MLEMVVMNLVNEKTNVLPENSNFNGLPNGEGSTFSETGKRFDCAIFCYIGQVMLECKYVEVKAEIESI